VCTRGRDRRRRSGLSRGPGASPAWIRRWCSRRDGKAPARPPAVAGRNGGRLSRVRLRRRHHVRTQTLTRVPRRSRGRWRKLRRGAFRRGNCVAWVCPMKKSCCRLPCLSVITHEPTVTALIRPRMSTPQAGRSLLGHLVCTRGRDLRIFAGSRRSPTAWWPGVGAPGPRAQLPGASRIMLQETGGSTASSSPSPLTRVSGTGRGVTRFGCSSVFAASGSESAITRCSTTR
jgi:hypothetical protein